MFFYCNSGDDPFYRNTFIGSSHHKLCPDISWLPFFLPSSRLHGAPSYTYHSDMKAVSRRHLLTSPPSRNYLVKSLYIGWEVGGIEFTLSLHELTFCPWEKQVCRLMCLRVLRSSMLYMYIPNTVIFKYSSPFYLVQNHLKPALLYLLL